MIKSQFTYKEAQKVLQIAGKPAIGHILINFRSAYESLQIPETLTDEQFIEAKNVLVRADICRQVAQKGGFTVERPWKDECTRCSGTGELYKFLYRKIEVTCSKCDEKGLISLGECDRCNGTGRFERTDSKDPDLRYRLECKFCRGTGERKVRCKDCGGTKKIQKLKIAEHLDSTTKCPVCKGYGFKPRTGFNPPRITGLFPNGSLSEAISSETEVPINPEQETAPSDKEEAILLEAEAAPTGEPEVESIQDVGLESDSASTEELEDSTDE